jgi:predicted naringenin-chalcone synthase
MAVILGAAPYRRFSIPDQSVRTQESVLFKPISGRLTIVLSALLAKNERMTVYVRSLETVVPPTLLIQTEARDVFAAQPGLTRLGSRLVSTCFDSAAIDTRYTAVEELTMDFRSENPQFFDPATGLLLNPSTKVRNDIFGREATTLFIDAARAAVDACPDLDERDITHLITVSCTGFFNPGPDYKIVRALGLNPAVQRYHLGFMGCYAAFPALRAARSFCEADPQAVVLVVCAELCSLHVRTSNDPDTIMGSALFADGAAAAVVTAREAPEALLQLDHFETVLTPVGEESMAWNIGDHGFEMVLGNYVPHIIDDHIVGALEPLLARDPSVQGLPYSGIRHWAIHPGGRSILDKVQSRLKLTDQQLVPARETLRNYGNMSSATVLFVLKHILEQPSEDGDERICSMAFGPGLTVETGLFTKLRQATGGTPQAPEQDQEQPAGQPTAESSLA